MGDEGCRRLAASYRENEASISQIESEKTKLEQGLAKRDAEPWGNRQREEKRRDLLVKEVKSARAAGNLVSPESSALKTKELLVHESQRRLYEVRVAITPLK